MIQHRNISIFFWYFSTIKIWMDFRYFCIFEDILKSEILFCVADLARVYHREYHSVGGKLRCVGKYRSVASECAAGIRYPKRIRKVTASDVTPVKLTYFS